MKYDFDTVVPRRGTNSYKWDSMPGEDILPMWWQTWISVRLRR